MAITAPTYSNSRLKLSDLRAQMKLILEAATALTTPARIHQEWKLKFDFGKVTSLLKPADSNLIHSWIIGTTALPAKTNDFGDFEFVGARRVDREVTFAVWGFLDYALRVDGQSSQELMEYEAELVADFFKENKNTLGFDVKPAELKQVKPFQIDNIDVHSFSEGVDVHVAQCSVKMVISRS